LIQERDDHRCLAAWGVRQIARDREHDRDARCVVIRARRIRDRVEVRADHELLLAAHRGGDRRVEVRTVIVLVRLRRPAHRRELLREVCARGVAFGDREAWRDDEPVDPAGERGCEPRLIERRHLATRHIREPTIRHHRRVIAARGAERGDHEERSHGNSAA
jgi:hypothetical protein